MSKARGQAGRVGESYYYGRRPEAAGTVPGSPYRLFTVRCFKCEALQVRGQVEYDEEAGETRMYLVCTRCGAREVVPQRI